MTQSLFATLHLRHDVPNFAKELGKIRAIRARGTRPQKIGAILYHRSFRFFTRERLAAMDTDGLNALLRSIAYDLIEGLRFVRQQEHDAANYELAPEECSYLPAAYQQEALPEPSPALVRAISADVAANGLEHATEILNSSWQTFSLKETSDGGTVGKRHLRTFLGMLHGVSSQDVWIGKAGDNQGKYSLNKGFTGMDIPGNLRQALSK